MQSTKPLVSMFKVVSQKLKDALTQITQLCQQQLESTPEPDEAQVKRDAVGLMRYVVQNKQTLTEKYPHFTKLQIMNILIARWDDLQEEQKNQYLKDFDFATAKQDKKVRKLCKITEKNVQDLEEIDAISIASSKKNGEEDQVFKESEGVNQHSKFRFSNQQQSKEIMVQQVAESQKKSIQYSCSPSDVSMVAVPSQADHDSSVVSDINPLITHSQKIQNMSTLMVFPVENEVKTTNQVPNIVSIAEEPENSNKIDEQSKSFDFNHIQEDQAQSVLEKVNVVENQKVQKQAIQQRILQENSPEKHADSLQVNKSEIVIEHKAVEKLATEAKKIHQTQDQEQDKGLVNDQCQKQVLIGNVGDHGDVQENQQNNLAQQQATVITQINENSQRIQTQIGDLSPFRTTDRTGSILASTAPSLGLRNQISHIVLPNTTVQHSRSEPVLENNDNFEESTTFLAANLLSGNPRNESQSPRSEAYRHIEELDQAAKDCEESRVEKKEIEEKDDPQTSQIEELKPMPTQKNQQQAN